MTNATAADNSDKLRFKTKLGFGLGTTGREAATLAIASYALLFYNQIMGLPAPLAGLALSAGLIFDGIADALVGAWSDRTRSRWGRRHPFMYAAPFAVFVSFAALWNPPHGLTTGQLFAWFAISVVALRTSISFFETPQLALGGELSPNYTERSKVMAYSGLCGDIGNWTAQWLALTFFFAATAAYPRGLLNPEPWSSYGFIIGAAMMGFMLLSARMTHDRIPYLTRLAINTPKFDFKRWGADLWNVLRNYNFVAILIAYFCTSMMIGMRNALHIYVNTFFWGLTSEQLRWQIIASLFGTICTFFIVPRLHGRFNKKRTMVVGAVLYSTLPAMPVWLGLSGIMQPGDPYVLHVVVFFGAIFTGAATLTTVTVLSMLADVADENELRFGVRQEGMLYAVRSFCGKVDQAIGAALGGVVLGYIAFPIAAKVGEIDPQVLHRLLVWDGLIVILPGVLAAALYTRLRNTRESYEATRAELAARRGAPLPSDPVVKEDATALAPPSIVQRNQA